MAKESLRVRKQREMLGEISEPLSFEAGIDKIKQLASINVDRTYKNGKKRKNIDQTVVVAVLLGIDPRQADQMVRGALSLPNGTGQKQRVIAFCDPEQADAATAAGAIEAGSDALIDKISKGWTDFDVAVSHPQLMGKVGKLGRVLGPQGKMPSPKAGTVTPDVVTAVKEYTAGKLEYRNDAGGAIHLRVGKVSFSTEDLRVNIQALIDQLNKVKPSGAKGTYMKAIHLSAQQTLAVPLAVA